MAGNAAESGRSVTSKITSILLTFTGGSEHSLTEIARHAGLPISTAHRLIADMTSRRLLERTDEGLYRVGLPLRMIGGGPRHCPSIAERAPCVLEDLAATTRRLARLGVLDQLNVAYIEKRPGHQPVTAFNPAATLPAHPTALGRALLAFSPLAFVEMTITRGLRPYTSHTVTSPDRFRRAVAITRLTGAAVTRYELDPQVCTVAMPVFGPGGDPVAAIELTVPDLGVATLQPALTALTLATRSLTRELSSADRPTRTWAPPMAAGLALSHEEGRHLFEYPGVGRKCRPGPSPGSAPVVLHDNESSSDPVFRYMDQGSTGSDTKSPHIGRLAETFMDETPLDDQKEKCKCPGNCRLRSSSVMIVRTDSGSALRSSMATARQW